VGDVNKVQAGGVHAELAGHIQKDLVDVEKNNLNGVERAVQH
jgi:hypothetical protein